MALYDNKYWLLSHIRNSFISTDDTGMCELVMTGESKQFKEHLLKHEPYPDLEDSEDEEDELEQESYDVPMDMDFGSRERPNTLSRIEKMDHIRKRSNKVKHIKWENPKEKDASRNDDLFIAKDLSSLSIETGTPRKSALTNLIEKFTNLPLNPYIEYSKFDGSGQVNIPIRKYRIYLTMLPEEQRNYPISISCIASAKIQDLIGLILLKYSSNHGDFPLKPVTNYGLYITEEDGEVDRDFPCLDANECVAKFGFTSLGLVEHKDSKSVSFDNYETLAIIGTLDDINKKRISKDSKIDETKQINNDTIRMDVHNRAMEAPLYQSYQVYIVHKMRVRTEILLGISGEKIEIDPVQQKGSKFNLVKQKAVSHQMDTLAWCEVTEVKSNRTSFRVIYSQSVGFQGDSNFPTATASSFSPVLNSSASFKHYDFEAENSVANEVVQKINLILNLSSSASRKEYLAGLERKNYKRKKL